MTSPEQADSLFFYQDVGKSMKVDHTNGERYRALQIAVIYTVVALLWVFLSDNVAENIARDYAGFGEMYAFKDSIFVVITALLLYQLALFHFRRGRLAEDSLRQAQARTESVLASVADAHIVFDRQWRYLYVNDAAVGAIGQPREQILGRTLWELYPDIVGSELDRQYHIAMDERLSASFDFHYPTNDSWWENRFYPVPEGLAVFATNITERRRAEEAVKGYAEEVQDLYNNAPCGYHSLDASGIYVRINDTELDWLGYDREEIIGRKSFADLIPEELMTTFRSNFIRFKEQGFVEGLEYEMVRKDGTRLSVLLNATTVNDKQGNYVMSRGVLLDITERKKAEVALREANELLELRVRERTGELELLNRTLQEEVRERKEAEEHIKGIALFPEENPSPVLRVSADGTLLYANKAAAGLSSHCIFRAGEHVPDFIRHEVDAALASGERRELEIDCEENIFLAVLAPIPERKYVNLYCINITERKRIELEFGRYREQLEEMVCNRTSELESRNAQLDAEVAQRKQVEHDLRGYACRLIDLEEELRKNLAADLHDEIGRDLTALGLTLAIVHDHLPEEMRNKLADRLEDARVMLESISRTVRDLMSELRPPVLDDYGLPAALRWHCDLFTKRSGIAVDLSMDENFPRLSMDKELALFRIAQESLTNVSKHAKAHIIKLSLSEVGPMIQLLISDDGVGFDTTQAFQRQEGCCWGLTVMRERAEAVNGEFYLDSAPGNGTRIMVELNRSE